MVPVPLIFKPASSVPTPLRTNPPHAIINSVRGFCIDAIMISAIADFIQTRIELSRDFVYGPPANYTEKDYPDLSGKVYIVTGASSGIGFETARLLAGTKATVYITGRTPSRIEGSLAKLRDEFPDTKIEALRMDYTDLSTIKPAIQKFLNAETRLDGIVHNAGVEYNGPHLTDIGYTEVLVVNTFAGQLVQTLLDPIMIKTAKSAPKNSVRIVWLASSAHNVSPPNGGIYWDDINNPPNRFGFGIYGQTKAINVYQAVQWAKHHQDSGIVSVSVHPGFLVSDICREVRDPLYYFRRPTIFGGYQEVYPLIHPSITTEDNGSYWIPIGTKGRIRPDVEKGANGENGERLWQFIHEQIKPYL